MLVELRLNWSDVTWRVLSATDLYNTTNTAEYSKPLTRTLILRWCTYCCRIITTSKRDHSPVITEIRCAVILDRLADKSAKKNIGVRNDNNNNSNDSKERKTLEGAPQILGRRRAMLSKCACWPSGNYRRPLCSGYLTQQLTRHSARIGA